MTPGLRVVTVGAGAAATGDPEGNAVVTALAAAGLAVSTRVLVDEDEAALEQAIGDGPGMTIVLAGAGGSAGDIVRRVLARAAGARLALSDRMLAAIDEAYRRRDRAMPRRAERLALLPQGATPWPSATGEPAWMLDTPRGTFAVLSRGAALGSVLDDHVLPLARAWRETRAGAMPRTRTLKVVGATVADVEERLVDWLGRDGEVSVVVVPAEGEVWIRLATRAAITAETDDQLRATELDVRARLRADCYGADGETLEYVVGRAMMERRFRLAVAEWCTGGLLGHRITQVPGASEWFERGVVVYSDRAAIELLGVPESELHAHGGGSAATAAAMVRGICASAGTACALSVTDLPRPDREMPAGRAGTVFIGLAVVGEITTRRFAFEGDEPSIRWQATSMALDMLRRRLGG